MSSKHWNGERSRGALTTAARAMLVAAVAGIVGSGVATGRAEAAVSTAGDVTPVPPAGGGAFAGPFRIGNVDVGTMSITGGTAISHTGPAVLGDTVTGIGIANLSGFNSDWTLTTAGGDMTVANNGTASLNFSSLAVLTVNDDLFVAAQLGSLGEISISGTGTMIDVGDDANIGQRGQAVIEVINGGRLLTDQNIIGDEPAGDGRVTLRDPFSLWRAASTITVGDAGTARLQVLNGARVENTGGSVAQQAGSSGTVDVIGAGSLWQNSLNLIVGEFGHGSLTIAEGGRVVNGGGANSLLIGRQIGSVGSVEVRDASSSLVVSLLDVGDSGDGRLRVLGGGRVTSGIAVIGDGATSRGEATVDGVGSLWEVSGALNVGDVGEGHLTVSGGGLVRTSAPGRVGTLGRLTLDGGRFEAATGLTNNGIVSGNGTIETPAVGNNAGARLQVQGAGALVITGTLNNGGLVDADGGVLEVVGPTNNDAEIDARNGAVLRFGGTGLDNNGGARLAVTSGTVDVFGPVNNDPGGTIAVGGRALAVFHDAVTNGGTFFVQTGAEVLTLRDLAFSPSSTLALALHAKADGTGTVGQVEVTGRAQLGGGLDVRVSGGSLPRVGDRFPFLTAGAVAGTFDTPTIPHDGGTIQFHPVYSAQGAELFVAGAGHKTWGVDASGDASAPGNWLGGVAPGNVDDRAAFTTIISANRTITIGRPMTAGSLYFDDDDDYVLQGPGGITLDVTAGKARIDVRALHGAGTHTIASPLALNDDTVIDVERGSVLRVTEPVSGGDAGLAKDGAGTLALRHVRAGKVSVNAGRIEVLPGGGAAGANVVGALVIAGTAGAYAGTVDLADNDLIVEGGDVVAITDYVRSARNASAGRWRGTGLTSSAATDDPLTTLAVGVVGDDVVVAHSYNGDANLDGRINADDYFRIDQGFLAQPAAPRFAQGDFNYDGKINADDYFLIDRAFLGQGQPIAGAGALAAVSVPEPAVACTALISAAGALGRRRRRLAYTGFRAPIG